MGYGKALDGLPHAAPAGGRRRVPPLGAADETLSRQAGVVADVETVFGVRVGPRPHALLYRSRDARAPAELRLSRGARDRRRTASRSRGRRCRRRRARRAACTCPVLADREGQRDGHREDCFHRRARRSRCARRRAACAARGSGADVFPPARSARDAAVARQVFGDPQVLAVLPPAKASAAEQAAARHGRESWRSDGHAIEFTTDADVRALPADRAVWLLGRGNALAPSRSRAAPTSRRYRHAAAWTAIDADGRAAVACSCGAIRPRSRRRLAGSSPTTRRRCPLGASCRTTAVLSARLRGARAGERAQGAVERDGLTAACGFSAWREPAPPAPRCRR